MKKILILLCAILYFSAFSAFAEYVSFYDMENHSWAINSVCLLAQKGIIKGTSTHYFSPESYVTKGQLCALVCRVFDISAKNFESFPDVDKNSYYHENVAALKALGILSPESNGYFFPESPATREETMRILGFLLIKYGYAENVSLQGLDNCPDSYLIKDENKEYIALLYNGGFVLGDENGYLLPEHFLIRAEVAVLLERVYNFLYNRINFI